MILIGHYEPRHQNSQRNKSSAVILVCLGQSFPAHEHLVYRRKGKKCFPALLSFRSVSVSKKVGIRKSGICLFISNSWIGKLVSQIGSDDSFYVITVFCT
jgi:hypothetical protein